MLHEAKHGCRRLRPYCLCSGFDALVDGLGLWKLETVGDAYIVAAGLFDDTDPDDRSLAASTAAATSLSAAGAGMMKASRKPARVRANVDAALSLALSMQVRGREGETEGTGRERFTSPAH